MAFHGLTPGRVALFLVETALASQLRLTFRLDLAHHTQPDDAFKLALRRVGQSVNRAAPGA